MSWVPSGQRVLITGASAAAKAALNLFTEAS